MTVEVVKYYAEQDPIKRGEILKDMLARFPDDEDWKRREQFYKKRFGKFSVRQAADEYLYAWMMMIAAGTQKNAFFKGGLRKDIKKAMDTLGFIDHKADSVVKLEIYDMATKYIRISSTSKQYGKVLFGIMNMSDKAVIRKLCKDIYRGAVDGLVPFGYPKESEEIFDLFRQAFEQVIENGKEKWEEAFFEDNES